MIINRIDTPPPPRTLNIIVPTHDSYIDVFRVYHALARKFLPDTELILSCNEFTPAEGELEGVTIVNNPSESLISERIRHAMAEHPADYHLIMLEDLLPTLPVGSEVLNRATEIMAERDLEYLRLFPSNGKNEKVRTLGKAEPYAICLMAFICTREFAEREFAGNITGWDFEREQLRRTLSHRKKEKFERAAVLEGNPLHLVHGVTKGKWLRKVKKRLIKIAPESFECSTRPATTRSEDMGTALRSVSKIFGPRQRYAIKKVLKKIGFKFTTEY